MNKIIKIFLFIAVLFAGVKNIQAAEGFILVLEGNGKQSEKFIYDGSGEYTTESMSGINYNESSNTLNINNYNGSTIYIHDMGDIKISASGDNVINASGDDHTDTYTDIMGYYNPIAYGFLIENTNATFSGNGKFSIDAVVGIYARDGKITFLDGEYNIIPTSEGTVKGMQFFDAPLEISNTKININNKNYGIDTSSSVGIKGNSEVNITSNLGIISENDLTISSGKVSVKANTGNAINCKNLTINSSDLYAETTGDVSITVETDVFTIEKGAVTINAKKGGINTDLFNYRDGKLSIESGTVGIIFKDYEINSSLMDGSSYKVESHFIKFGLAGGYYYTFTNEGRILASFNLPDYGDIRQVDFCYKTSMAWQIIGIAFMILKILIPVIIIVLGIIDLSKVVTSGDEKDIKDKSKSLAMRIAAGIVIFLVPSVVSVIFNLIATFIPVAKDYENCIECISSPNKKCDTTYNEGIFPVE